MLIQNKLKKRHSLVKIKPFSFFNLSTTNGADAAVAVVVVVAVAAVAVEVAVEVLERIN